MMGRRAGRRSSFVDSGHRKTYLEYYDAMLRHWPTHDKVDVTGRYGRTAVLTAGPPGAPTVVLLHGRYIPSPSWAPLIGDLAAHYRVYAVDTIGEPGLSSNDGAPLRTRTDYPTWLSETLDGLGLDTVHLCGYSFGGWLAAHFAVEQPRRLTSLTLLDPAQVFAPFTARWLLHCARPFLFPTESNVRRLFDWAGGGHDRHRELVELATLGMRSFRIRSPETARIPADRLRSLTVPAQQLIAEHSVVHNPQRALRTANRTNPAVTSHLIGNSTHFMPYDQPARVLSLMKDIIDRTDSRLSAS